jgi:hypothetical protein
MIEDMERALDGPGDGIRTRTLPVTSRLFTTELHQDKQNKHRNESEGDRIKDTLDLETGIAPVPYRLRAGRSATELPQEKGNTRVIPMSGLGNQAMEFSRRGVYAGWTRTFTLIPSRTD